MLCGRKASSRWVEKLGFPCDFSSDTRAFHGATKGLRRDVLSTGAPFRDAFASSRRLTRATGVGLDAFFAFGSTRHRLCGFRRRSNTLYRNLRFPKKYTLYPPFLFLREIRSDRANRLALRGAADPLALGAFYQQSRVVQATKNAGDEIVGRLLERREIDLS